MKGDGIAIVCDLHYFNTHQCIQCPLWNRLLQSGQKRATACQKNAIITQTSVFPLMCHASLLYKLSVLLMYVGVQYVCTLPMSSPSQNMLQLHKTPKLHVNTVKKTFERHHIVAFTLGCGSHQCLYINKQPSIKQTNNIFQYVLPLATIT